MIVLSVPCLLSHPVLAELQRVDLITSEECEELSDTRDVVDVQRSKSSQVILKTAIVMRSCGLEKDSKHLLAGRQSSP